MSYPRIQSNIPHEDRFALRVNDAAQLCGISRSSIYVLIAEGRLKSAKVSGRRVILRESLQDLLGSK